MSTHGVFNINIGNHVFGFHFFPEFVFEIANNHWGSVERGLQLIQTYCNIAKLMNIKAAVKLQYRDVPHYIHKDFMDSKERYIQKTKATALTSDQFSILVNAIREGGCIPMTTCFDETSVGWARDHGIQILKMASSEITDWILWEECAKLHLPMIASSGGSSLKDLEDIVKFCKNRNIPLAINHCVSKYPTEDPELHLDQIDFLKKTFPHNVIGYSSHEYRTFDASVMIAYAKGARTFERHVDIPYPNKDHEISPYCANPDQTAHWIQAYLKAKQMCGGLTETLRVCDQTEITYLDKLCRGVYAKADLKAGESFLDHVYLAIPLQKGQLSAKELQHINKFLIRDVKKDAPITIEDITCFAGPLKDQIKARGI